MMNVSDDNGGVLGDVVEMGRRGDDEGCGAFSEDKVIEASGRCRYWDVDNEELEMSIDR